MAYSTKIDILRPREIANRYTPGTVTLDYSDPEVIPVAERVALQPTSAREPAGGDRYSTVTGWLLVTQPGVDIPLRSTDRVRAGSLVLSVLGEVMRWPHPIKPDAVHHVEANLEVVTG